jgi:hypothetical protein
MQRYIGFMSRHNNMTSPLTFPGNLGLPCAGSCIALKTTLHLSSRIHLSSRNRRNHDIMRFLFLLLAE